MTDGFIPPHGGYQKLLSYRKAEIVCFLKEGGLRERMTRSRIEARNKARL